MKAEQAPKLSKAARKAQHIEQQKQLWDTADNPDRFHWLEAQGVVPLKQEYKAPVMLLSRKPILQKKDASADDEDSEDERRKVREAEFEERQRKAKVEREEKQKRYAEARKRIMGSSNIASPASKSRDSSSQGDNNRRGRGKHSGTARRSHPQTPKEQSPNRNATSESKLFDPDDMGRRLAPMRAAGSSTPNEDQPTRQPRGPDNSGRGGFGFASRGGRLPS